uniref:Ubiquitin-like domain-containing protein n=1 Tax=Macrostomum lignano TaxID=282301 RepID=A0A1I8J856_9PLAT
MQQLLGMTSELLTIFGRSEFAFPLLPVLLSGLAFALAWLMATVRSDRAGSLCQAAAAQPIAVFLFQPGSVAATASALTTVANDNNSRQARASLDIGDDDLDEVAGSGEEELRLRQRRQRIRRRLAGYSVDLLDSSSEGELDAEWLDRVEDVLLEYATVTEASSSAELATRRLKYFNCLVSQADNGVQSGTAGSASPSQSNESSLLSSTATTTEALLRLKYFDDRQEIVEACARESIDSFLRRHFSSELSLNRRVRLICQGRELLPDAGRTLSSYSITNGATIHCLITPAALQSQSNFNEDSTNGNATIATDSNTEESDIGSWLFPLACLGVVALSWCVRLCYRPCFNGLSTMALGCASLVLCAVAIATLFPDGLDGDELDIFDEDRQLLGDEAGEASEEVFGYSGDVVDAVRRRIVVHRINLAESWRLERIREARYKPAPPTFNSDGTPVKA